MNTIILIIGSLLFALVVTLALSVIACYVNLRYF